jgi:hypothetical protein
LGILFSSTLPTCPNQRNLCSLIFSVMVVQFHLSSVIPSFLGSFQKFVTV